MLHLGLSCDAKDLVQITQEALMKRRLFDKANRPVLRSDNGPQFIGHRFQRPVNNNITKIEENPNNSIQSIE